MASQPSGHASLIGFAFGGYEVQALIGRGAMGTVYLARDIALNRQVALKVLLGSIAKNPVMVRSFYREAQAAAPLRHPGIVRVYSAGIEGGTPYIAMEYVAGEPLDRFLRRKGQISWQAALYIGGQVAAALQCAHEAGIVHRDVKPANILLDRQGRARLADFGIARVRTVEQPGGDPGVIGTPQYMSPEQCVGGEVSEKTDLYSLGVTIFQMIAGEQPFKANSPQVLMRAIASDSAPRLNRVRQDVPDDVARLVAHLLEKDPERRPENAQVVCQTIERLQSEDGGRSAIPQALAAYVREQAQDSPLRLMTPPPSRDKSKPIKPEGAKKRYAPRHFYAIGIGVVSVLAIAIAAFFIPGFRESKTAQPAQVITNCQFTQQRDASIIAELPAPAYSAARIGWAGDEQVLLVEAVGVDHSLARGGAGVLAMQPGEKRCTALVMPAGRTFAEGIDAAAAFPLALSSGQRSSSVTPAVLLGQRGNGNNKYFTALVFAQRFNEGAPDINPVATYETNHSQTAPWAKAATDRCMHAVMRPDGGALCMLIKSHDGANYLVEQRVHGGSPQTPIVAPGSRIVPQSIQYTPAGDRVLFMREHEAGKRELWSAPVNGGTGTLLALGYFSGECAVNSTGNRVAIACSATPTDAPELQVIDGATGALLQRLGNGSVGHDAWMCDEDVLIAAIRGENGIRQLAAINMSAPEQVHQLTSLPQGVGEVTAVSSDGRWAAGIAEGKDGVRVVFVDLSQALSTRTASVSPTLVTDRI